GERSSVAQAADEATNAVILAGETMLANEVLEDALRRQAGGGLGLNEGPKRLTQAGLFRPGGRAGRTDGRLACLRLVGADGRLAYFAVNCAGRRLAYFAVNCAGRRLAYFAVGGGW